MLRHRWALALAFIIIAGCSIKEPILNDGEEELTVSSEIIPLEKALSGLEQFLKEADWPTKSMSGRRIRSVDTYYSTSPTKSAESLPNAYIINFEDNEGFAVLGANIYVDDIVAVTERGSIDPETLCIAFDTASDELFEEDWDPEELSPDALPTYCEEDEDFYSISTPALSFIRECIMLAIDEERNTKPEGESSGSWTSGGGTNTSTSPRPEPLATVSPLLNYSWYQEYPYNKYCFRRNLAFKKKSALTGCSTTAMAMIVAANRYPDVLTINDTLIVWPDITSKYTAYELDEPEQNQVALLMGSIYNDVCKIAVKGATLITPEQIKKQLKRFKYSNVRKYKSSSLSNEMIRAASTMLEKGKPVFISAIPKQWRYGHSWVIDGAKYSTEETYLLHFNFGWGGKCNGFYSTSCLNPTKAEEYDKPYIYNEKDDYRYSWHFRLITYDIPSSEAEVSLDLNFDF